MLDTKKRIMYNDNVRLKTRKTIFEGDNVMKKMICDKVKFISIRGKSFVHTGLSVSGGKGLETRIKMAGGICKSAVSGVTDYLIVDSDYNGETTKYAKALDLRATEKNNKIRIVDLKDFLDAFTNKGVVPNVDAEELVAGIASTNLEKPRKEKHVKEDSPISLEMVESCKEYIRGLTIPTYYLRLANGEASLTHSHVGGYPYWPKSELHHYPKDTDGFALGLIAQIRFDDIEQRCNNDYYPNHGMIQFFGRCGEDEYEMDVFNGEKRNLKIVYWENVIEDESQLLHKGDPSIPKVNSHLINSDDGFNVNIATKDEQVPKNYDYEADIRSYILEKIGLDLGAKAKSTFKSLTGISASGWLSNRPESYKYHSFLIRLGGVPSSLNREPKMSAKHINFFTFESRGKQQHYYTLVGDCGFVQYYISKEDLLNLDFNNVEVEIDMC